MSVLLLLLRTEDTTNKITAAGNCLLRSDISLSCKNTTCKNEDQSFSGFSRFILRLCWATAKSASHGCSKLVKDRIKCWYILQPLNTSHAPYLQLHIQKISEKRISKAILLNKHKTNHSVQHLYEGISVMSRSPLKSSQNIPIISATAWLDSPMWSKWLTN